MRRTNRTAREIGPFALGLHPLCAHDGSRRVCLTTGVTRKIGISPSWYLSSVELRIEVYTGRGTLNVTSDDVTVGP
jgi:hypothetical protein